MQERARVLQCAGQGQLIELECLGETDDIVGTQLAAGIGRDFHEGPFQLHQMVMFGDRFRQRFPDAIQAECTDITGGRQQYMAVWVDPFAGTHLQKVRVVGQPMKKAIRPFHHGQEGVRVGRHDPLQPLGPV